MTGRKEFMRIDFPPSETLFDRVKRRKEGKAEVNIACWRRLVGDFLFFIKSYKRTNRIASVTVFPLYKVTIRLIKRGNPKEKSRIKYLISSISRNFIGAKSSTEETSSTFQILLRVGFIL